MCSYTFTPLFAGLTLTVLLSGCSPDLVPLGKADLTGPPSFCKKDPQSNKLIVTVKNQGRGSAAASTTTVEFNPGGSFPLPTAAIAAGGTLDLTPLEIPAACYNPDCEFKITVDSAKQINESDEDNNSAEGSCLG